MIAFDGGNLLEGEGTSSGERLRRGGMVGASKGGRPIKRRSGFIRGMKLSESSGKFIR